jgi:hypothetical protein
MTASRGQEVDRNLLRGGALGSAQARADPQDAGRQDLGDLVEAFGWGHEVGVERFRHSVRRSEADEPCSHCSLTQSNGGLSGCILCR